MDKIHMSIQNIKNIDKLEFDLPTEKGLYALTGENGAGKSTILCCAAQLFYNPYLTNFYGTPRPGAKISLSFKGKQKNIYEENGKWCGDVKKGFSLGVTGFYEGSIVFGKRFKNIELSDLVQIYKEINYTSDLFPASSFVKKSLGSILHDDENYYNELYELNGKVAKRLCLERSTYFYKNKGSWVTQLNMSTGENLLLTVLNSIERRLNKSVYGDSPSFIFLDEVELALHSSALRRLCSLLKRIADEKNIVIIFSTHSIELVRSISPRNIFYLQLHNNNELEIINPCYPVYATRNLEASSYGYDFIVLVEDDLAKQIVDCILNEKSLMSNKRVLVIAVGGWHQVLRFAHDAVRSNFTTSTTKILTVLDRDIKEEVPGFLKNEKINFPNKPSYLPIKSLEKFLLDKLINNLDIKLFRELNDYIFQGKSLDTIIKCYNRDVKNNCYKNIDALKNGKTLFNLLNTELRSMNKTDSDLIEFIVKYLNKNMSIIPEMQELYEFFTDEFSL